MSFFSKGSIKRSIRSTGTDSIGTANAIILECQKHREIQCFECTRGIPTCKCKTCILTDVFAFHRLSPSASIGLRIASSGSSSSSSRSSSIGGSGGGSTSTSLFLRVLKVLGMSGGTRAPPGIFRLRV
jgi:hypothetical protein